MAVYTTWAVFTADPANAGITEAQFNRLAVRASRLIDRITGWPDNTFTRRTAVTQYTTGRSPRWLQFAYPPLTVTSLSRVDQRATSTLAEIVTAEDESEYWIPGTYPDNRARSGVDHIRRRWVRGRIYKLVGNVGFTDDDGATPPEILWAHGNLIRWLYRIETGTDDEAQRGFVRSFSTDNFSYEIGSGSADAPAGILPGTLTGRPDIDGVLAQFRRTIAAGDTYRDPAGEDSDSGYPVGTVWMI